MDRTLLLVDDEPNILSALTRLFRREAYQILRAQSGEEGLALLASHPEVGVIISDQRMPGMLGVAFLARVKQLYPDTIRMVLSGYTELESVTEAINRGAVYKFLTKPWEDDLLLANVEEAFQRFEMSKENLRLQSELQEANHALQRMNAHLERVVQDKTQELARQIEVLQVSQEILQSLPLAILGVDEMENIVFANQIASELFADYGNLLGEPAAARLPDCLLSSVVHTGSARIPLLQYRAPTGQNIHCWKLKLGLTSFARGWLLVAMPVDDQARMNA